MTVQEESVLAIGSGSILLSLVESWYESGLSKITVFITDTQPTDVVKLKEIWELALRSDPEAILDIHDASWKDDVPDWRIIVRPFPFILYVSQHGDPEELKKIQHACVAEGKQMLHAIVIKGTGIAGPLLSANGDGLWKSAWRHIHSSVFPGDKEPQLFSITAGSLLSNVIVHEWRKVVAGEQEPDCNNQCYILEPVTLTGEWHPILKHPLVSGYEMARPIENIEQYLEKNHESLESEEWFSNFNRLTSTVSGIFHVWEEADLIQLPLAQCRVQPVDPLSEGPAQLLPAIVRSGLTHEEARLESGLAGLEAYFARMIPLFFSGVPSLRKDDIGIGIGFTIPDAVERGLRAWLTKEWSKRTYAQADQQIVTPMACTQLEDVRCRYYLQALITLEGKPLLAFGEPLLGFPVVWVYSGSAWYGSVDLCFSLALRQSLQKALSKTAPVSSSLPFMIDHVVQDIAIANIDPPIFPLSIKSAVQTLKQHRKRLEVFDVWSESFMGIGPFTACGVIVGEEVAP